MAIYCATCFGMDHTEDDPVCPGPYARPDDSPAEFDQILDRSSLGAPEVKAIRAMAPKHLVDEVLGLGSAKAWKKGECG
jgi:hypothetical protein